MSIAQSLIISQSLASWSDAHLGSFQEGVSEAGSLLRQPAGVLELLRQVLEYGGNLQRVCIGLGHLPARHPELARPHRARICVSPCGIGHDCTITKPFNANRRSAFLSGMERRHKSLLLALKTTDGSKGHPLQLMQQT